MYSSKGVVVVVRRIASRAWVTRKKRVFPRSISHNLSVQSSRPQNMALDVASLTLDDSQASLASMPEELWRKVTSYLRRRPAAPRPDGRQPVGWFRGLRAVTYVSKSIKRPMARGESTKYEV